MRNKIYKFAAPSLILLLIFYFTVEVYSKYGGISGRTSTSGGGCQQSGCHSSSASSATSVTLTSGSLAVEPGSTNSYTIRVSNSNSSQTKAGINIAVKTTSTGATNAGTLSAESGSGLQSMDNELTHTSPKDFNSQNADFDFKWTAPTTSGTYYLRAVGNAVNGDGSTSGDVWNFMTVQEIIVKGIQLTEPTAANLSFCLNNTVVIKWTHTGVTNVKIELSSNGGSSWETTIAASVSASAGSYSWSIPAGFQTGSQFRIRVSDASSPTLNSSSSNNFSIAGGFSILSHPESKEVCSGSNHTLKVSVAGAGTKFQWFKDNNPISLATDSSLVINNIDASKAGSYKVVVSSNCQADVTSNSAVLSVIPGTNITVHPVSKTICSGQSASFNVTATGHNLSYQWYHNNQKIDNATNNEYIIESTLSSSAGAYYCELTSICGIVKSNTAELKINSQPAITKQPLSVTVCEGKSASFDVEASGMDNIYEWYLNEVKLNVPSSKFLNIENVADNNKGEYHCLVINSCGEPVRSEKVVLTVNLLPKIILQPANKSVTVGDKIDLEVKAENGTLSYQWRKDNKNIDGAKSSTYSINSAKLTDAGDYDCVVTNSCGNTTSTKVKINVDEPVAGSGLRFLFETVNLGKIYSDKSIDTTISNFVTNNGTAILEINSINISGNNASDFEVSVNKMQVAAGESIPLTIKFSSNTKGIKTAKVEFNTNTEIGKHTFDLSVEVLEWKTNLSTSELNFGNINIGTKSNLKFKVINQSENDVNLISGNFDCDNKQEFKILSPTLPLVINAQSEVEFDVEFDPASESSFDCNLILGFSGTDNKVLVNLKGAGVISSVEDNNISEFRIFPNPVSESVGFEFSITESTVYELQIIDMNGNIVKSYVGNSSDNLVRINWDGKDISGNNSPSGNYFAILKSGNSTKTINIILIK